MMRNHHLVRKWKKFQKVTVIAEKNHKADVSEPSQTTDDPFGKVIQEIEIDTYQTMTP